MLEYVLVLILTSEPQLSPTHRQSDKAPIALELSAPLHFPTAQKCQEAGYQIKQAAKDFLTFVCIEQEPLRRL